MTYNFYDTSNSLIPLSKYQDPYTIVRYFTEEGSTTPLILHSSKTFSIVNLLRYIKEGWPVRLSDNSLFDFDGAGGGSSGGGGGTSGVNLAGAGTVITNDYPSNLGNAANGSYDKNLIMIVSGQSNSFGSPNIGGVGSVDDENAFIYDRASRRMVSLNEINDAAFDEKTRGTFSHFFLLVSLEAKKRAPYGSKVFALFTGRDGAGWIGDHFPDRASSPVRLMLNRLNDIKSDPQFSKYFTDNAIKNSKVMLFFQGHESDTKAGITDSILPNGETNWSRAAGSVAVYPPFSGVQQLGLLSAFVDFQRLYLEESESWKIPFYDFEAVQRYTLDHVNDEVFYTFAGDNLRDNYVEPWNRTLDATQVDDYSNYDHVTANREVLNLPGLSKVIPNSLWTRSLNIYTAVGVPDGIHFERDECAQFAPMIAGRLDIVNDENIDATKAPIGGVKLVSKQTAGASLTSSTYGSFENTEGLAALYLRAQNWVNDDGSNIFNWKNLSRFRSSDGYLYFRTEADEFGGTGRTIVIETRQKLDPSLTLSPTDTPIADDRYNELYADHERLNVVDSQGIFTTANTFFTGQFVMQPNAKTTANTIFTQGVNYSTQWGSVLQPGLDQATSGIRLALTTTNQQFRAGVVRVYIERKN